jgi:fimbrial chaperone protein
MNPMTSIGRPGMLTSKWLLARTGTLFLASCLASILPAAVVPAVAGTFSISPIRVELSAQQRTEALTVRNESADREVVVQAQTHLWSQQDAQDKLTDTRDLIVTPPVFTLGPNSQQIVRVALRRGADPKRELSYRLILQEVPPEAPKNFTGLQVALRLSLPVFVAPQAATAPNLTWSAAWQRDGSLLVTANNQGDLHLQVIDFDVRNKVNDISLRNSVVKYVLPGATMNWVLQPPVNTIVTAKQNALTLRGASDRGEIAAEFTAAGP